ncbi:MAG: acylphosphatase [Rhodocyclaceae bacterium]|nr:acylphosphatase [Rhodocyclaceae bacterium]MBK6554158.1 acylphosphatase [Rhodocyclaceae bacterium]MBK6677886.1 acylphosphatase [Rhodocyclaceae bacterium]MBK7813243.1 acylphosphatase [Rhodocyclaceae bacterium]MBK9310559.1 acylphosphatase [Rhodocyclaceae bacterium]
MTEKRRLLITGLVQGVGYRQAMVGVARRLTLTGWVRNRRDGSVEAEIAGGAESVAAMIDWARHGPARAEVAHVAVELGTDDHEGFEQLPTT